MTPQVRRRSGDLFTIQQHEIGPVVCDLPHSAGCDSKHRSGIATRAQCGFVAPRLPYLSPLARARALLARPWSAGCYGVARQREGSRQNGIGGLRRAFSPAFFGLVLFIPWRVGAEQAGAAKDTIMAYGFGGAVADFGFSWLRGTRVYLIYHPYAG